MDESGVRSSGRSVGQRTKSIENHGDVDHLLEKRPLHRRDQAERSAAHRYQAEADPEENALERDPERSPTDRDGACNPVDAIEHDNGIRRLGRDGGAPALPMAMPTSASASAGASLIPSPTMTTGRSSGLAWIERTTSSLSSGDCSE